MANLQKWRSFIGRTFLSEYYRNVLHELMANRKSRYFEKKKHTTLLAALF